MRLRHTPLFIFGSISNYDDEFARMTAHPFPYSRKSAQAETPGSEFRGHRDPSTWLFNVLVRSADG
jgi:hypothetical protein